MKALSPPARRTRMHMRETIFFKKPKEKIRKNDRRQPCFVPSLRGLVNDPCKNAPFLVVRMMFLSRAVVLRSSNINGKNSEQRQE